MNKKLAVLDCTLRDGGYINDWNFGHDVIQSVYRRLDDSGVEFIEVGFLDDRRPFDIDRTIFPDTNSLNKVFAGIERKGAIPVAMIDYGTCSIDNIGPAEESFIDGIRVIFKKEKIDEALPFCEKIKAKGYKLFIQAISITAYSDEEMLNYVGRINKIKPYAFSIVDTYGLLDNKTMARYFYLIDNNLDPHIVMGYHEHNNFQLGFSNTVKFLEKDSNRLLCADSTVYGMGKSAGNCATELLTMKLNSDFGKSYDLAQILEIIDTSIMPIYAKHYWGYKLDFFIAAMQRCHPSYVQYLLNKKTLSITAVDKILASIPKDKKLHYDAMWIENAYHQFQDNEIDDSSSYARLDSLIRNEEEGGKIILIGPGHSTLKWIQENKYKQSNIIRISLNFDPKDIDIDFVFISNSKRYAQIIDCLESDKLKARMIITSNITPIGNLNPIILNYASLQEGLPIGTDNALLLFLNALTKMGIKKVELVGFDGFDSKAPNYCNNGMSFNNIDTEEYNSRMTTELTRLAKKIQISFMTPTKYATK